MFSGGGVLFLSLQNHAYFLRTTYNFVFFIVLNDK